MASNFHIQKPYVLTALPRPLDQANGRYVVGEVFGQQQGSARRKKRPEVTVGIDGEAANIYDVASSRLVTSYPIPPQSSFTCAPCSSRWRYASTKDAARYTYISTADPTPKITLFKDMLGSSGETTSTTASKKLSRGDRVIYLVATSPMASTQPGSRASHDSDLVAVTEDGRILCLGGEALDEKWKTSSDLLTRDFGPGARGKLVVEHARLGLATDIVDGIYGGNRDAFNIFPQKVEDGIFNPDVLVLVTTVAAGEAQSRHLHILALTPTSETPSAARQDILQVQTMPIGKLSGGQSTVKASLRLDLSSGSLLEIRDGSLISYNLSGTIPREEYSHELPGVASALRISKTSILTSSATTLDVYNPAFHSLQGSTSIDLSDSHQAPSSKDDGPSSCSLVLYFARLQIAVGILGTSLVAVQLEAPKSRDRKRRAEGLLIDSIGRGISSNRPSEKRAKTADAPTGVFSTYVPGSVSDDYLHRWAADTAEADRLLSENDLAAFEKILAEKLGVEVADQKPLTNGVNGDKHSPKDKGPPETELLPEWLWPAERKQYPRVDRRWVLYAISHVFAWQGTAEGELNLPRLRCQLPDSHVLNYLVDAGHLTTSNLKSAFKEQLLDVYDVESILGRELPEQLAEIDPTMELLLGYLTGTKLRACELLSATRLIMKSLELVRDPIQLAPKLLTLEASGGLANGDAEDGVENGDIGMELDLLEQELQVAEDYLGDDEGGIRARGLSVAFSKLAACPPAATVTALRQTLKPEEILSLIWLLRMELNKDGWTTRYLDTTRLDQDDELEPPPDSSICLIAGLLCRCLDAVGPGGWLINDALLVAGEDELDSADFLTNLTHEVSAALQGIQEAVFLRGIIGQVVKYAYNVSKNEAGSGGRKQAASSKPTTLRGELAIDGQALPLGLKPSKQRVGQEKILSSGEVLQRSKREVGHLLSRKVEAYSLERIVL